MPLICFLTCTRDRSTEVARLARSIAVLRRTLLGDRQIKWYIVDDNTTDQAAGIDESIRAICVQADIQLIIVTGTMFERFCHGMRDYPEWKELRALFREPGHGPWDAAGVRNLASAIALSVTTDDDIICWVDDDVILASVEDIDLIDRRFDYARVIHKLGEGHGFVAALDELRNSHALAVGVPYVGVADVGVAEHILLCLERLLTPSDAHIDSSANEANAVIWCEDAMPAFVDYEGTGDGTYAYGGPGGIGTGFMLTRRSALAKAPFPRFVNEDWLWALLLGDKERLIRKSQHPVAHLPPPRMRMTVLELADEVVGNIVCAAAESQIRIIGEQDHVQDRAELLAHQGIAPRIIEEQRILQASVHRTLSRRLRAEAHSLGHLTGQAEKLAELIDCTMACVERLNVQALASQIQTCAALSVVWQRQYVTNAINDVVARTMHPMM